MIGAASVPVVFQEKHLQISCRIGISLCINGKGDREEPIHHADLAMYQVTKKGKSDYNFYDI